MRIDRVYTRGGDQGETSLIGGERVSKASARLDGYGTVDELNATLGLVCEALAASAAGTHLLPILRRVQNELFNLGAELA
ncbi:MAG: ATP:cob(I)alamin adenosyltransferase, partial [bacterium]